MNVTDPISLGSRSSIEPDGRQARHGRRPAASNIAGKHQSLLSPTR
jgi:hypothetical protein